MKLRLKTILNWFSILHTVRTDNNLQTWNRNDSESIPMNYATIVNICYQDITEIFMNTLYSLFVCCNEINKNWRPFLRLWNECCKINEVQPSSVGFLIQGEVDLHCVDKIRSIEYNTIILWDEFFHWYFPFYLSTKWKFHVHHINEP